MIHSTAQEIQKATKKESGSVMDTCGVHSGMRERRKRFKMKEKEEDNGSEREEPREQKVRVGAR